MNRYQQCTYCVMDNAGDNLITFDDKGECNYCKEARYRLEKEYFPNEYGKKILDNLLMQIKKEGKGKEYDCLMGISGGLDSSYLAYLGKIWGLRILGVHIDDGFDTDISKKNIKKLCDKCNIELKIVRPDQEQYLALEKSYMLAGVPDLAVPQDNILAAQLYKYARENNIKYFLSGGNFALESILQKGNMHNAEDIVNIKDIHKKFGILPINKLEFISTYKKIKYNKKYNIKTIRPLNYIDYNREKAFEELKEFCDFEYYGAKHLENIFTAFLQIYWLPNKFNVDKRKSHLSSMIVSKQLTREEALQELKNSCIEDDKMQAYIEIIKKKLNISNKEFRSIMVAEVHQHEEYKTEKLIPILRRIKKFIRKY